MSLAVTKRDIGLLIGLVGVLLAVLAYNFAYTPYTEKTKTLETENKALEQRVQILQSLADQRDDMLDATKENNEKTKDIIERFPVKVTEEDIIMFAVELEREAPYEYMTAVQIGLPTDVYAVADMDARVEAKANELLGGTQPAAADAAAQQTQTPAPTTQVQVPVAEEEAVVVGEINYDGNYTLKARTAEITAVATYEGFKEAIEIITKRNDRTQLSVTASYDMETGLVDSNISLVTNYMEGTGKTYREPEIPFVPQGTNNIFGTIELSIAGKE